MGHLLSSAIKMQGSAPTTATLILQLASGNGMGWFKNGFYEGAITGTQTFTLNAGDTFYVGAYDFDFGITIDYLLNGTYVTSYSDPSEVTTPTFTAVAGNTYRFNANSGF
jgi:hypothetical protein